MAERAEAEQRRLRRGVAAVPDVGLQYAEFYELKDIALRRWDLVSAALGGNRPTARVLLERIEGFRNRVAHSRPLGVYEADMLSGTAGQIRNQVTLYMSSQDPAGDTYPRIESITDSFGLVIEGQGGRARSVGHSTRPRRASSSTPATS